MWWVVTRLHDRQRPQENHNQHLRAGDEEGGNVRLARRPMIPVDQV